MKIKVCIFLLVATVAACSQAANYPAPTEGDYVLRDVHFNSGESLPELRMHYRTLGSPQRDKNGTVRNAVLILHGTTGSSAQFLRPEFADELFGKGQLLDATRYYIIIPDNIGHGNSSKPSDGLHAKFPKYGYLDMIEAQRRLLVEGLGVTHLQLLMGTSMGGMHAWLWGETHPDFMDALMPLASLPTQISGRNRIWRRIIVDAIRGDPEWLNGDYKSQPQSLRTAAETLYFMSCNPVLRAKEAPTLKLADENLDQYLKTNALVKLDANDVLYAVEASRDYDPGPGLEKIIAPLLAINSADDLINPPGLRVLEREIKRVKHGREVVLPLSDQTVGHGSHTKAVLWKKYLEKFLKKTERKSEGKNPSSALRPPASDFLLHPDAPEMNRRTPNFFNVRLETCKGEIEIEIHRDWAPHGVDRFYNLVRAGYYDGARFFRVSAGKWAQFGINGDPKIANTWRARTIPDDPRIESNVRGTIDYAFAIPNGRTTQVFINLKDNSLTYDGEFVPFGKVVKGMEVTDALNAEYAESAGGGIRGGRQAPLFEIGDAWLKRNFPRLDYIMRATVIAPLKDSQSKPWSFRTT